VTTSRWHDSDGITRALGPLEPASSPIVAAVAARGTRRGIRVWRTGDGPDPSAVLCSTQVCRDRWVATVVEAVPGAAVAFAPLLAHGPARRLTGPTGTVRPLLAHLAGVDQVDDLAVLVVPAPVPVIGDADPGCRLATPADLARLVELFRGERLEVAPTLPRLRRILADEIRRGDVLVVEADGRVVGAARHGHRTAAYVWVTGMVVDPAARGHGHASRLLDGGSHLLAEQGVGVAMTMADTNPMRPRPESADLLRDRPDIAAHLTPWVDDPDAPEVPTWTFARLRGRRVPSIVRRAWRALELLEGPVTPRR